MTLSRRSLLAAAPALAILPGCQRMGSTVVDVKTFGAKGDGSTDDSRAIQTAVAALRSRCTLYFPRGTYRFAQQHPRGAAAIVITGVSDVGVEFDPGAELLMDNLDSASHTGTSHGLLVRGPVSRIALRNVNIRWATGAKRSFGDGIRVMGFPASAETTPIGWSGSPAPVDRVTLSDCTIRASPQTGIVMLGVSDIVVAKLRVADSGADGLHFNACRRARIDDYTATNTGDDGLALVTYFADRFTFDDASHTFAFPALTDWSNADFAINDVSVLGGSANGIRIAGAHRVTVGSFRAIGVRSGSAVMVDSAEPGAAVGWNYVASRAVRIDDVAATDCNTGIHVLARPFGSGDRRFTDFDVYVDDARIDDCSNWSVQAESLSDHAITGFRMDSCSISSTSTTGGNGGVGVHNAQRISLGNISVRHAEPVVAFSAMNAGQLAVDRLSVTISTVEQPEGTAAPCVTIDGSDGVISDLELDWSAAPDSWTAVRLSGTGQCSDDMQDTTLTIGGLKVVPPVSDPVLSCT